MRESTMVVLSFLKGPCVEITYTFFIITNNVTNRPIDLMSKVFGNGLGDRGSIPDRGIPKIKKWHLIPPCLTLSTIRYVSKVKWTNPEKNVAPSPYTSVL